MTHIEKLQKWLLFILSLVVVIAKRLASEEKKKLYLFPVITSSLPRAQSELAEMAVRKLSSVVEIDRGSFFHLFRGDGGEETKKPSIWLKRRRGIAKRNEVH